MVTKNLKLDLAKIKKAQGKGDAARANTPHDQWSTGTVVEALDNGLVAVELDGTDDDWPPVVAPADPGVTAIGASVRVIRDSTGRVSHVAAPDVLPDGANPLYVGSTGQFVKDVADAQVELDSAIAGATADAAAAQSAAQSAANDAAAAMVDAANASAEVSAVSGVAEAANDAAAAAQSAAGEAITVASTKTSVKASKMPPDSPMTNDLWFPLDVAGNVIGMKKWTGSSWVDYRLMAGSFVVPGSVGNILLENGAVSAEKIFANEALWAKIATFASVTTDMLLAGGATITGTLLADVITLATRLVAGDPNGSRTELDQTGLHVYQGSTEKVQVSASDKNGLRIWDSNSSQLVDLADAAFGSMLLTSLGKLSMVAGATGKWGAWVGENFSTPFISPTSRCEMYMRCPIGDVGVAQNFYVRGAVTLLDSAGTQFPVIDTGAAVTGASTLLPNGAIPQMGVNTNLTPGATYTVRAQFQASKAPSGAGTPWVSDRNIVVQPI